MATIDDVMARLQEIQNLTAISVKNVLNIEEAAIYTGYSTDYLYRLRKRHEIAYSGEGRNVRYRKSDLDDFMMQHRAKPNYEIEQEASRRIAGIH